MYNNNLVSIIIPCYNCAMYIAETLNSIFNQSYKNLEIIIIDDGSLDDSLKIINTFLSAEHSIKLIQQKNQGQTIARQNGATIAQGNYLLFLDADDKLHPDYLLKCVKVMESAPQVGIVYSRAQFFEASIKEWVLSPFNMQRFLTSNSIYISALIRKQDFDRVAGFDTALTFFEDWELFISIIKLGKQVVKLDEILFYYRQRTAQNSITNISNRNDQILSENMFHIYKKHYALYTEYGLYFKTIMDSFNKYHILKNKYYGIWYKKLFYTFSKKKH